MGDKLFASVLIGDLQEAAEHGSGNIGYWNRVPEDTEYLLDYLENEAFF
ncbi:MAG: hypothetical protein LKM40_05475 [Mageeibacillus sp.]|jgi:hypothetical protein|nr:hypothetical protein [Mageeibacillus sp.]